MEIRIDAGQLQICRRTVGCPLLPRSAWFQLAQRRSRKDHCIPCYIAIFVLAHEFLSMQLYGKLLRLRGRKPIDLDWITLVGCLVKVILFTYYFPVFDKKASFSILCELKEKKRLVSQTLEIHHSVCVYCSSTSSCLCIRELYASFRMMFLFANHALLHLRGKRNKTQMLVSIQFL